MRPTIRKAFLIVLLPFAAGAAAPDAGAGAAAAAGAGGKKTVQIRVTAVGFEPSEVKVKQGEPVTLVFTRETEKTCITAVDIPAEKLNAVELPLGKPVAVTFTPKAKGVEKFHCSAMGMGNGRIVVE